MRARVADIIRHASALSGISVEIIVGKSRPRPAVRVRQAVCLIAREQREHSFPMIARCIGKRDHSTIVHAVQAAAENARRDPSYAEFIENLRSVTAGGVMPVRPIPPEVVKAVAIVPPSAPRSGKVPPEHDRVSVGKHSYTLDEDGLTYTDRLALHHMVTGSRKLVAAMERELAVMRERRAA